MVSNRSQSNPSWKRTSVSTYSLSLGSTDITAVGYARLLIQTFVATTPAAFIRLHSPWGFTELAGSTSASMFGTDYDRVIKPTSNSTVRWRHRGRILGIVTSGRDQVISGQDRTLVTSGRGRLTSGHGRGEAVAGGRVLQGTVCAEGDEALLLVVLRTCDGPLHWLGVPAELEHKSQLPTELHHQGHLADNKRNTHQKRPARDRENTHLLGRGTSKRVHFFAYLSLIFVLNRYHIDIGA